MLAAVQLTWLNLKRTASVRPDHRPHPSAQHTQHTHTYKHTHTHRHTYSHTHTHTHKHRHTYTHTHTNIDTHTQTHTQARALHRELCQKTKTLPALWDRRFTEPLIPKLSSHMMRQQIVRKPHLTCVQYLSL